MKLFTGTRSLFTVLILVSLVFGLQACSGGGGGSSTTPAVNTSLASAARGYYEGFATINVTTGDLTISSPNFRAIVDEKQFVIAFVGTPLLLYKGSFTEVTATSFKANIRVYKDGAFVDTATISNGAIDEGVTLKGTITGTGDYVSSVGDVELTYNAANNLVPKNYVTGVTKAWQDTPTTGNITFNQASNIDLLLYSAPVLNACKTTTGFSTTNVVYAQTGRIRAFTSSVLSNCADGTTYNGATLSGYLTNFNSSVDDDRMLVIMSNDQAAYIGILSCGATPSVPSNCITP